MNSKATKTLSVVSAMILTLLIVLTMVLSACSVPTVIPETPPEIDKPVYDGALTEEDEEMEQDKVYELSENITFLSTSAESNTLNNGINLSATVLPVEAEGTPLDWSVEWFENGVGYTEEFANANPISDYATITPTTDGANTAVLMCIKPFPAQIFLQVRSRDYTNRASHCILDFAKKIIDVKFSLNCVNTSPYSNYSIDFAKSDNVIKLNSTANYRFEKQIEIVYSVGTVQDSNYTFELQTQISAGIAGRYLSKGYMISTNNNFAAEFYKYKYFITSYAPAFWCSLYLDSRWASYFIEDTKNSSKWNALFLSFIEVDGDMNLKLEVKDKYSPLYSKVISINADVSALYTAVSSVSLNNENLIFQ